MDRRLVGYWIATGLFCAAMLGGGIGDLLHLEYMRSQIVGLGYPEYLLTLLGVAKLAGVVALAAPRLPLLKEWAYAGFTFDLLGAATSHAFAGDPLADIVKPLLLLAIAATSYLLRPSSRRISGPVA